MSNLNLPVLAEVKKPEIKIPEISSEPIAPEITQEEIFVDKEVVINSQEPELDIKPVKPKRKLSQKQLDHLAKMRENRMAKKKAKEDSLPAPVVDVRSPTIAPRKDGPPKKASAPASTPKPDNFYQFMDYMEKYKSIKKSWRERDAEKKRVVAPKPPTLVPQQHQQQAQPKPKMVPVKKPTTDLLNIKKARNPYSAYF